MVRKGMVRGYTLLVKKERERKVRRMKELEEDRKKRWLEVRG